MDSREGQGDFFSAAASGPLVEQSAPEELDPGTREKLTARAGRLLPGLIVVSAGATLAAVLLIALVVAGLPAERPMWLMGIYGLVAGAYALSYVVTAVLWMWWQSAAHAVHSPDTQARTWWWLIPLANFVLPYRAVRDLLEAGDRRAEDAHVVGWWTAMIIAVVAHLHVDLSGGFFVQALTAPPDLGNTDLAVRAVGLLAVPVAGGLAVRIVRTLTPDYGSDIFQGKRRVAWIWFSIVVLVGAAIGAVIVFGTQDTGRQAQAVVDQYIEAARDEDAEAMFDTVHPDLTRFFDESDAQQAFEQAPRLPGFKLAGYQPDTVEGMDAMVVSMTTTTDGVEIIANFTVVNNGGDWQIGGVWVNAESVKHAQALRDIGQGLGIPEQRLNLPKT